MSENRYTIDRERLEDVFIEGLENAGFDARGNRYGRWSDTISSDTTTTTRFTVRPYSDFTENHKPNLTDTFTGLNIWWYKYALRDAYANRPLSKNDIKDLMAELAKDTETLGAKPVPRIKDTSLHDMRRRQALIAEIAKNNSLDVSSELQDELSRFLNEVSQLRLPASPAELAWAIRLDRAARKNHIVIAARPQAETSTNMIINEVSANDDKIIVNMKILAKGAMMANNMAILFSGSAEEFNNTVWSKLTMERLGRDCPDLSRVQTTRDAFVIERDRIAVQNVTMLDVRNDWSTNEPVDIRGTATISFEAMPAKGHVTLSITETDGTLHKAELTVKDLRTLVLLAEMHEQDWFDIDVERGAAAGRVALGDSTMTTSLDAVFEDLEMHQNSKNDS